MCATIVMKSHSLVATHLAYEVYAYPGAIRVRPKQKLFRVIGFCEPLHAVQGYPGARKMEKSLCLN